MSRVRTPSPAFFLISGKGFEADPSATGPSEGSRRRVSGVKYDAMEEEPRLPLFFLKTITQIFKIDYPPKSAGGRGTD